MAHFPILDVHLERGADRKLRVRAEGQAAGYLAPLVEQYVRTLNGLKIIAEKDGANVYNLYNPPQPSAAGLRALSRKLKDLVYGRVYPATANIALTSACQCRCVHCSADLFRRRDGAPELATHEVKRVVDEALDLGANLVVFTGGEPTLRKDLAELVRYVDKERAAVMMFSNGLALDEALASELAGAGLFSVCISLDGARPETHDRLRGVDGCFRAALEGAERLRRHGVFTGVSTYATAQNLASGELEALMALARDEGFHEVTVFDCIPSGRFLHSTGLMLTPGQKEAVIALGESFHRSDHPMGVVTMARVNSPLGAGCFGGFTQLYVSAYGDVNPCDFNPVSFGSVREFPLEALWERMVSHREYGVRKQSCRMQSPRYRSRYIEPLPEGEPLPVPIEALPGDGTYDAEAARRAREGR